MQIPPLLRCLWGREIVSPLGSTQDAAPNLPPRSVYLLNHQRRCLFVTMMRNLTVTQNSHQFKQMGLGAISHPAHSRGGSLLVWMWRIQRQGHIFLWATTGSAVMMRRKLQRPHGVGSPVSKIKAPRRGRHPAHNSKTRCGRRYDASDILACLLLERHPGRAAFPFRFFFVWPFLLMFFSVHRATLVFVVVAGVSAPVFCCCL